MTLAFNTSNFATSRFPSAQHSSLLGQEMKMELFYFPTCLNLLSSEWEFRRYRESRRQMWTIRINQQRRDNETARKCTEIDLRINQVERMPSCKYFNPVALDKTIQEV